MNKNKRSQRAHASVLSTHNRQLPWTGILLLTLFLAFGLANRQPGASAQAACRTSSGNRLSMTSYDSKASVWNCPQQCEQGYVECLSQGGANCGPRYDACLAGCSPSGDLSARTNSRDSNR